MRALEFPDRVAASDETRRLTYAELDRLSSAFARELNEQGVVRGALVGLYMARGVDMLVALLGILKAGGAYLPIDPAYPRQRIAHIVADSGVGIVVCTSDTAAELRDARVRVLAVDALRPVPAGRPAGDEHADAASGPDDLAYVIYTSGSTGKPKGVMVEHRNVLRLVEQSRAWFEFDASDVWSLFHSIGFDFSVWEVWGAWLSGAHVAVVPYPVSREPAAFHRWLARTGVTIVNQTPSAFRHLDAVDRGAPQPLALRYVIFGGEALPPSLVAPWIERHGDAKPALVNMYGITETTVHVSFKRVTRRDAHANASPIGVPLPHLRLHLLDERRRPVADGVAGEIYVEGAGVARGYLNRPELTAERFVQLRCPQTGGLVRAYKTGDLAMRGGDGEYVYVGRADDQLKIRGFRIEPAEIEAALMQSARLSACHVRGHDYGDGDQRIVAYVVPSRDASRWSEAAIADLKARALAHLPDYMRPSAYVVLAGLPLTAHGKIDKHALPSPETAAWTPAAQAGGDAGQSDELAAVLRVWRERLGLKGIGPDDDFFAFGGTSLALIRSFVELKSRYGIEFELGALASGATAAALAGFIRSRRVDAHAQAC
ncbi:amino acid adenylation domain-containing protein [Burkholderia oklahomensis]|uniref:amino acid adenylation domain-containing protein n=1 Tax=Burkholderia oklahomensis TaxID=342113 RepID=UPI00016AA293|nr:amino acid adenylation domain-containing protein [Burkholderia oklahomensis]AJX30486.1 amino acid adenylation domain protein [Burkholderia oklahomensis C6786]AOI45659.1 thioester reductase [Burkholderia oklahomensis C6786]KUY64839.1 thioester reductase [Burkholderia oklahomensis C6786]MBI0358235.1 amino acid adenylation domain-containing protein [Burkholderia oklahomensis]SUW56166.1 Dimodular nonribosomal peptide synthase [Burkholderia oklahomensis]